MDYPETAHKKWPSGCTTLAQLRRAASVPSLFFGVMATKSLVISRGGFLDDKCSAIVWQNIS